MALVSPQEQQVLKELIKENKPLSVVQLAQNLKIVPNSVYRLVKPLIQTGLVKEINNYPHLFQVNSFEEAQSLFLLSQSNWFSQLISSNKASDPTFSFLQSRDELMNVSLEEYKKAAKTVDLLRSGGEIPADLLFEMIQSQKRGVKTRMLIQEYSKENEHMVKNWIKNGIDVRYYPSIEIRLMIYDKSTVYFMSYRHSDSQKDLGFKITYPPFATILSHQFDQWWKEAEIL